MIISGAASNFWRFGLEPSGLGRWSLMVYDSVIVMFKMRWVMEGGTPVELVLPAFWIVLTAFTPLTTWPKSEYVLPRDSPEAPVTMKNWLPPVCAAPVFAIAMEYSG